MATTFAHTHTHWNAAELNPVPDQQAQVKKSAKRSVVAKFFRDLFEDLSQKPLQAAIFAKHDMFREHINAMSISYFALIVLLIAASVPMLGYLVPLLAQ